jgi:hypothetical protein
MRHLKYSKHTLAIFAFKHNIYLLLGRMEARCRAGHAYQQHAGGGDVPADIHPGEHVQEMEGGEAGAEVAWLPGWRATGNGSPRLLSYSRDEQKKRGRRGICSVSMHRLKAMLWS